MDNGELSSLDFKFVVDELRARLLGGIFRKIYQFGKKQLAFVIYVPRSKEGDQVLYADNKRMFIASERMEAPEEPPNFCMFLRKHLMGREIRDIRQHGFDRVIEMETDESILIFEFLPPGNVILCDKFYNIIMPLEVQRWKHREVKPKGSYLFPPSQTDLTKIEIWDFFQEISGSDKDVASTIAGMGLGQTYALEVCSRAGIKPDKPAYGVTVDEATEIFNVFKAIMNSKPEPRIYDDLVSAVSLTTRKTSSKPASSVSEAFDIFFSRYIEEERSRVMHVSEEKASQAEAERVERIENAREEAKETLSEKKEEKFTKAQLIYRNYVLVSNVLEGIARARNGGMSWQQIKERLVLSQGHEAKAIREIRENDGIIIVDLEGNPVELDLRRSVEENAGHLFEGAKKIKKKLERMEQLPPPEPRTETASAVAPMAKPEPKTMDKVIEEVQATLTGNKLIVEKLRRTRKPKKPEPTPEQPAPKPMPETIRPSAEPPAPEARPQPVAEPPMPAKPEPVQSAIAEKLKEEQPAEQKPKSRRRKIQEIVSGKETIALPTSTKSETSVSSKPKKDTAVKRKAKGRWYETYRWFISSEGNIVIAGKNAVQNESVIKSRFKDGDVAFHADIHGAAFVVAKAGESGNVGPLTIKEAVEFAAAHSKTWSSGYGEVDVMQFSSGSLAKTTPEGSRLPRGSFYAPSASETHEKVDVRISIGVQATEAETSGPQAGAAYEAKVYAGPLMPVRKLCKYFVTIQPGSIEGKELAQKIKNALLAKCMPEHRRAIDALPLDEFSRHIPSGAGSLVG